MDGKTGVLVVAGLGLALWAFSRRAASAAAEVSAPVTDIEGNIVSGVVGSVAGTVEVGSEIADERVFTRKMKSPWYGYTEEFIRSQAPNWIDMNTGNLLPQADAAYDAAIDTSSERLVITDYAAWNFQSAIMTYASQIKQQVQAQNLAVQKGITVADAETELRNAGYIPQDLGALAAAWQQYYAQQGY